MEAGKSKIHRSLLHIQAATTCDVRVHLSKSWIESDFKNKAVRLFQRYKMNQSPERNSVLVYYNLRRKKFAIVYDLGVANRLDDEYWKQFTQMMSEDLQSTYFENAIALNIMILGVSLQKFFPSEDLPQASLKTL